MIFYRRVVQVILLQNRRNLFFVQKQIHNNKERVLLPGPEDQLNVNFLWMEKCYM